MKYYVKYAVERIEEVNVDNINEVYKIAEKNKKEGEIIISIQSR